MAQAYGRECCLNGYKTYYLKATELRDKLKKAAESGNTSRTVASLVKPSCLIVDEVGRCAFDKACTDLFFDVFGKTFFDTLACRMSTLWQRVQLTMLPDEGW